jgi:RiboL-PSP-HEPN
LAKFGAVQICGFVERSVEIVVLERLTGRAHSRVVSFVKGHFKRGTNYDCEAICQLLARFDLEWEAKMRAFLKANDNLNEAMKSAYTLRNAIAHGGQASRGLAGVIDLYKDAKKIVEALVECTE